MSDRGAGCAPQKSRKHGIYGRAATEKPPWKARGKLGARIRLERDLLSFRVALLDDEVGRVPFDHALDLRLFMSWNDREVGRLGTNRLVLVHRHRDRLRA